MKIALLGYGIEGKSAYGYWNSPENQITICDQNLSVEVPPRVESKLGPDYLSNLSEFDLIVRCSPQIHPRDIVRVNSEQILDKVTTIQNELFRVSPTKNIIGVTGTKGKGTTSTLITRLLETSGRKAYLAGNIGNPSLDLLKENITAEDWLVLELSNFQLIDLRYSPHIAVCLLIVPEHLDWHSDMDEYLNAKGNIFSHQNENDIAIYYADNQFSKGLATSSPGHKIAYFDKSGAYVDGGNFVIDNQVVCATSDTPLLGQHNWQNICAALTAYYQVDQNLEVAQKVISEFKGLEHRLELVRTLSDVKYFNDSFASGPGSSAVAIDAIKGPKVLIMGGFERGLDLDQLAEKVKDHESEITKVILMGATAQRLSEEFTKADFTNFEINTSKSIDDVVRRASAVARPGDSVLFSPGFASFDMFKNFEDRGLQYKAAVNKL